MNREPTAIITAIGVFLSALTKAAVLLNLVDWDAEQLAGISLVIDSGRHPGRFPVAAVRHHGHR
jgi:hypothetical protein